MHRPGRSASFRRHRLAVCLLLGTCVWLGGTAGLIGLVQQDASPPQTRPQSQPSQQQHEHRHDATTHHEFDDVERWVDVFDDPNRAEWQKPDRIPGELALEAGMTVADIGAGTGYFERFFSGAVGPEGKVYAVDVEPKMVEHLARRAREEATPNVFAVLAAPDDPRLPDGGVDVVFICDTWHHIDDRIAYLDRLRRALKPGGILAVVDFHKRELPVGPPPQHKLSREEVVAELAEGGWTLTRESVILPYQYFLIFRPAPRPDRESGRTR